MGIFQEFPRIYRLQTYCHTSQVWLQTCCVWISKELTLFRLIQLFSQGNGRKRSNGTNLQQIWSCTSLSWHKWKPIRSWKLLCGFFSPFWGHWYESYFVVCGISFQMDQVQGKHSMPCHWLDFINFFIFRIRYGDL